MFYTAWKIRLSTADCTCISGFWGLCHRPCPWTPRGGTSVPQIPCAHPTSKSWLRHWYFVTGTGRWCQLMQTARPTPVHALHGSFTSRGYYLGLIEGGGVLSFWIESNWIESNRLWHWIESNRIVFFFPESPITSVHVSVELCCKRLQI